MISEVDAPLAELLQGFAAHAGSAESPPTPVSVAVSRRRRFTNEAVTPAGLRIALDEPADFGGSGEAPDPAEFLLAALGASLSVTLTAHAALRGLAVQAVELAITSEIDGRSFFDPRRWTRAGLLNTRVELALAASMTRGQARALLAETLRASPVFRSIKPRPRVVLTLTRTA